MGRLIRDAQLQSIESRAKLKARHDPYWRMIAEGVHLGYRKGVRGGVWIGRIRIAANGYRRITLGHANDVIDASTENYLTFSEAQKKVTAMLEPRAPVKNFSVGDAIEHYLEWFRHNRKSVKVTETVIAAHITPTWKSVPLAALRTDEIRAWHQALAKKPPRRRVRTGGPVAYRPAPANEDAKRARKSTANRVLTILKAILNKAYEDDMVSSQDVWRKVKPFANADEPIVRFLTTAEATRLINASDPALRRLVQAALMTGARYAEITGLKLGDYSSENASVYIRPSKTAKGRHVPLSPEGVALFDAAALGKKTTDRVFVRSDGSAWGKNHHVRSLLAACAIAKIEPAITFHELRHTYASLLAQAGADLLTISKLLGHADTRITSRHYAHLCDKTLAIAVNRFLPTFAERVPSNVKPLRKQITKRNI